MLVALGMGVVVVVVLLLDAVIAIGVVMVETSKALSWLLALLLQPLTDKVSVRDGQTFFCCCFFFLRPPLLCTPQGVSVCSGGAAEILQRAGTVFHSVLHFLSLFKWPADTFMKETKPSISREFKSAQLHSLTARNAVSDEAPTAAGRSDGRDGRQARRSSWVKLLVVPLRVHVKSQPLCKLQ